MLLVTNCRQSLAVPPSLVIGSGTLLRHAACVDKDKEKKSSGQTLKQHYGDDQLKE
jgi:hypothetical protein